MGEKVYKPIVKNGDHLIRSKDNPDRVRGLTRDENNQNPDIIEWEEYDLDDLQNYDYDPYPYEASSSGKNTIWTICRTMIMIHTLMKNDIID